MRKSQKCPTNRLVVGPPRPSMKFRLPGIKSGLFIPCLFWALFTFLASPSSIRAAAWNIETVEAPSTGGVGYPSIALDAAGRPHISYSAPQGSGSVLKLASKLDSSWSSQTADPDANVVGWTSLKLYKDEPRISYYDHSDFVEGRLKFAYRNGSVWTNQIVDEEYHVDIGWQTSLALDADGKPRIAYLRYRNNAREKLYEQYSARSTSPNPFTYLSASSAETRSKIPSGCWMTEPEVVTSL